jgi:hypothetical protein
MAFPAYFNPVLYSMAQGVHEIGRRESQWYRAVPFLGHHGDDRRFYAGLKLFPTDLPYQSGAVWSAWNHVSLFYLQSLFYRSLTARVKERLKDILRTELEFCRNQFFFSPGEFAVRAAFSEPEMMNDRVYCVPFRRGGSDGLVQTVGRLNRAVFNFLLDFELCPDKVEFISVGLHMQYHPTPFMRYRQRRIRRFVDLFINRCRMAVQRRRVAAGLPAIPLRPAP